MGGVLEKLCFKPTNSNKKNYGLVKNNNHNISPEQQKILELESLSNQILWFDRTKPILFDPKKFLGSYPEYQEDQVFSLLGLILFEFSKYLDLFRKMLAKN